MQRFQGYVTLVVAKQFYCVFLVIYRCWAHFIKKSASGVVVLGEFWFFEFFLVSSRDGMKKIIVIVYICMCKHENTFGKHFIWDDLSPLGR